LITKLERGPVHGKNIIIDEHLTDWRWLREACFPAA
jgi:hypothetical protein